MRSSSADALCAYCSQSGADEEDHVVARQFFPADQRYRGSLPKVPCHGYCNREKQRVEDGPAVLFQFGHDSDASRHVLTRRVLGTLAKNRRLHTSLRQGLQEVLVRHPSGLVVPALGIALSTRELADSHAWFRLVTRGLYYFEFRVPLAVDHTIHLLRPTDHHFNVFIDLIRSDRQQRTRAFAGGEFQYAVANNVGDGVSLWLYAFKSINMLALTLSPGCPSDLRSRIGAIEWPTPGADSD
jgi:hypothetical protein